MEVSAIAISTQEKFMREALKEARKAYKKKEVPIGAVIVKEGQVIARAHNLVEAKQDPTAHAEIIAIKKATKKLNNERLKGTSLYVTIEPCPMCAGALVWARVDNLVYGADDPKAGAAGSIVNIVQHKKLNHRVKVTKGILEKECRTLVRHFFKDLRA